MSNCFGLGQVGRFVAEFLNLDRTYLTLGNDDIRLRDPRPCRHVRSRHPNSILSAMVRHRHRPLAGQARGTKCTLSELDLRDSHISRPSHADELERLEGRRGLRRSDPGLRDALLLRSPISMAARHLLQPPAEPREVATGIDEPDV